MGNAHACHNLNTTYMNSLLMGLVISVNKLVINFWIDSVFNEVMLLYYKSSMTQECYFSTPDSDLTQFQHILLNCHLQKFHLNFSPFQYNRNVCNNSYHVYTYVYLCIHIQQLR